MSVQRSGPLTVYVHPQLVNCRGFTFIEAIVTLTIVGVVALPLLTLISQSYDQLMRASDAIAQANATESALAIIDPINPYMTPRGQSEFGSILLSWDSEVLVEPNELASPRVGLGGYRVGFYKVTVSLRQDGEPWFTFETRKVGYERITGGGPFDDSQGL